MSADQSSGSRIKFSLLVDHHPDLRNSHDTHLLRIHFGTAEVFIAEPVPAERVGAALCECSDFLLALTAVNILPLHYQVAKPAMLQGHNRLLSPQILSLL